MNISKIRLGNIVFLLSLLLNNSYADESLLDIYMLSLESDPEIKQVQIEYDIARETKKQSLAQLFPTIHISGDTMDNAQKRSYDVSLFDGKEDYNSHGYSLRLKQSLFRYENHISFQQARGRIKQANAELMLAGQALIIRVSERYFNVLAAQDNLRFFDAEKKAVERQLAQAKSRLNAGLVAITDVYETQARLDNTIAQEVAADNQLANNLESLREVTNRYHEQLRPLAEFLVLLQPELADIKAWEELALAHNLQIISLRHNNFLLKKEIDKQKAGRYPTLDLVATYSRSISGGGNFGRSDTENRAIGLQLNLPIYLGGATGSRIREARQQYNKNLEKIKATIRSVKSQTRKHYLGVIASIAQVQSLKQSIVSNKQALKGIEAGYELGMRTTFDVLQANRELYRTQRDYQRARYDYVLNGLRLKQSVGDLSLLDLKKANSWLQ
ncbi:Type I secretion outer membrane protein, TolC family [hydrothermal vent metagenome]|uniref:Type I secretion outer membrane protein, TolC family n=1 Tax=hydrothermal vent metagenome TaxID=652676 RepID=A0A3B0ZQF2_9ZZZZ